MSKVEMIKERMAARTIHIYKFQGPKVMRPTQIPGLMTPHTIPSVNIKGELSLALTICTQIKTGKAR